MFWDLPPVPYLPLASARLRNQAPRLAYPLCFDNHPFPGLAQVLYFDNDPFWEAQQVLSFDNHTKYPGGMGLKPTHAPVRSKPSNHEQAGTVDAPQHNVLIIRGPFHSRAACHSPRSIRTVASGSTKAPDFQLSTFSYRPPFCPFSAISFSATPPESAISAAFREKYRGGVTTPLHPAPRAASSHLRLSTVDFRLLSGRLSTRIAVTRRGGGM